MSTQQMERYSFLWSELRLGIAAIALLLGGVPPIYKIGIPLGLAGNLLKISWIISGVVAVYLLYLWNQNGQRVFGGKKQNDLIAFFVSVVSGINLGIVGLFGRNIGMSISSNKMVFVLVAIIYIATAVYMYNRWVHNGRRLF